jgi:hypothetical protein
MFLEYIPLYHQMIMWQYKALLECEAGDNHMNEINDYGQWQKKSCVRTACVQNEGVPLSNETFNKRFWTPRPPMCS